MEPERLSYIAQIKDAAISACSGSHLFPSLMIAQACLEGNNGRSQLARLHHNCFGIKASGSWKGNAVTYKTTEYIKGVPVKVDQRFRSYPDIIAGFADRIHFLQINSRYGHAGVFQCHSPEEQAGCFLKAGYATDPAYAKKLIAIINTYYLKQYDPS